MAVALVLTRDNGPKLAPALVASIGVVALGAVAVYTLLSMFARARIAAAERETAELAAALRGERDQVNSPVPPTAGEHLRMGLFFSGFALLNVFVLANGGGSRGLSPRETVLFWCGLACFSLAAVYSFAQLNERDQVLATRIGSATSRVLGKFGVVVWWLVKAAFWIGLVGGLCWAADAVYEAASVKALLAVLVVLAVLIYSRTRQ